VNERIRQVQLALAIYALGVSMGVARADQALMVTEYACRSHEGVFILTTHAFDSEDGDIDSTPGFHKIKTFGTVHISCNLGRHKLRASLWMESQPRQGDTAQGRTIVERMSVDGIKLFDHQPILEWGGRPLLVEMRVNVTTDGLSIDSCTARNPDSTALGRPDLTCESKAKKLK
jgi:hypothetical protein